MEGCPPAVRAPQRRPGSRGLRRARTGRSGAHTPVMERLLEAGWGEVGRVVAGEGPPTLQRSRVPRTIAPAGRGSVILAYVLLAVSRRSMNRRSCCSSNPPSGSTWSAKEAVRSSLGELNRRRRRGVVVAVESHPAPRSLHPHDLRARHHGPVLDAVTRTGTVRDITLEEPTIEEGSWGASAAPGRPDRNWHDLPARQDPRAMRPTAGEKACAACQGAIASWM